MVITLDVAIPYYCNSNHIAETLSALVANPHINKIVIEDDASPEEDYQKLLRIVAQLSGPKFVSNSKKNQIQVIRRPEHLNIGCYENKRELLKHMSGWTILLDADNILNDTYIQCGIEAIEHSQYNTNVIFAPECAISFPYSPPETNLMYTKYAGQSIDPSHVLAHFTSDNQFICMMNTGNYIVHAPSYCRVITETYDRYFVDTIDVAVANTQWICSRDEVRTIYVVPGMTYAHRMHDSSISRRQSTEHEPYMRKLIMDKCAFYCHHYMRQK